MADCLMCGSPLPADAKVCPTCQTPVETESQPPPPAEETPPVEAPARRVPWSRYGIIVGAVAAIGIFLLLYKATKIILPVREPEALVPRSMTITADLSPSEVWKTLGPFLREIPAAGEELKQFEQRAKLSIEKDIFGTFGSHVVVAMDVSSSMGGNPDIVGVFPISKSLGKARAVLEALEAEAMKSGGLKAKKFHRYGGVPYWTVPSNAGTTGMAVGIIRRCVVAASTETAIKKVIDVAWGRARSITSVSGYEKVNRALPRQYVARLFYNMKDLIGSMPVPLSGKQKSAMEAVGSYGITIQLPQDRILMTAAVTASDAPAGKETLASWKKLPAMSGGTHPYLPAEALMLLTMTNVSEQYKQAAKNYDPSAFMFMPPGVKSKVDDVGKIAPKEALTELVSTLTGETSLSVSIPPGKKQWAFLLASEATNQQALTAALDKVEAGFAGLRIDLQKATIGNAVLRSVRPVGTQIPAFTYAQAGNVLLASNDGSALKECLQRKITGGSSAASSKDISSMRSQCGKNASYFMVIDLRQLKGVLSSTPGIPDKEKVTAAVDRLGVIGGGGQLVKDVYVASFMTSSTLKDFVQSAQVVGALAGGMMMKGMASQPQMGAGPSMAGKPAPDFSLKDVTGKQWSLSALRGKVVVMDFSGTYDPGLSKVQKAATKLAGKPVQFLLVSNESADFIKRNLKQNAISLPTLMDAGNTVSMQYGFARPLIVLVDQKGVVQRTHPGYLKDVEATLTKEIEALLAGKTLPPEAVASFPPPDQFGGAPSGSGGDPFTEAREKARRASCQSNLKQLALGALMYAQDYGERFPPSGRWNDAFYPYLKNRELLTCPSAPQQKYGYALNSNLDRVALGQVLHPAELGLLFDSSSGKPNAADPGRSWCQPPRHQGGNNAAFVDGHVKWVKQPPTFGLKK